IGCVRLEISRKSERSFFFSSRRRHTRWPRDWSSDVCSSDLIAPVHLRFKYKLPTWNISSAFRIFSGFFEYTAPVNPSSVLLAIRSEERRVGKESRTEWWTDHCLKSLQKYRTSRHAHVRDQLI